MFSHQHVPYSIVLDVGSGSVGVAIIEGNVAEKKPLILYTHREPIRITRKKSPEDLIRTLEEALLSTTLEVASTGMRTLSTHDPKGRIGKIYITYASPWSTVMTRFISHNQESAFKITDRFVSTLIDQALTDTASESDEHAVFKDTEQVVINRVVIHSEINGYPIKHFTGQEGTELRVAYLTERVPQIVKNTIETSEKNLAPHANREERAFVTASYAAISALFPTLTNALLLEVSGEATDCSVIEGGVLCDNFSTLFGVHSFYRILAERLGTVEAEARSHIHDYEEQTVRDDVRETIAIARETYKGYLRKVFDEIQTKYVLPEHLVLIFDPEVASFFTEMVDEVYTGYRNGHIMHHLDQSAADSLVMYTDECVHDHYLALSASFFHTEQKKFTV